jgi:hypothetical protein
MRTGAKSCQSTIFVFVLKYILELRIHKTYAVFCSFCFTLILNGLETLIHIMFFLIEKTDFL